MGSMSAQEIAREVLYEALGSSATPFVPVPWVDDWLVARLLRRIARKVMARRGLEPQPPVVKAVVEGYMGAGAEPLATKAAVGAVRFVVRKVAVVLDVKKSHDVFGQAIAFAFALDRALVARALADASAYDVGAVLHRAVESAGSAALEGVVGSVRASFAEGGEERTRRERIAGALSAHVDEAAARIASAVDRELAVRRR